MLMWNDGGIYLVCVMNAFMNTTFQILLRMDWLSCKTGNKYKMTFCIDSSYSPSNELRLKKHLWCKALQLMFTSIQHGHNNGSFLSLQPSNGSVKANEMNNNSFLPCSLIAGINHSAGSSSLITLHSAERQAARTVSTSSLNLLKISLRCNYIKL